MIKENWNSQDKLLVVVLTVSVHAWFGSFKGVARLDEGLRLRRNAALEKKGGRANLPGGGTRFYIPALMVGHIARHVSSPL